MNPKKNLNENIIAKVDTIGKGGFGKVSLYRNATGSKYAVKTSTRAEKNLLHQYKILKYLRHRKICSNYLCVKGKVIHHGKFGIVVNYLNDYTPLTRTKNRNLSRKDKISIAKQLLEKLMLLHDNNIVHGDIKPANMLVNPYTKDARIIDFGGAVRFRKNQQFYAPHQYTKAYFGQCRKKKEYTWDEMRQNDFWALGISFLQFFELSHRFPNGIHARNANRANRLLKRKLGVSHPFFECLKNV